MYGARDVEYTVCALVELPNSMSYRYGGIGSVSYTHLVSVDFQPVVFGGLLDTDCRFDGSIDCHKKTSVQDVYKRQAIVNTQRVNCKFYAALSVKSCA